MLSGRRPGRRTSASTASTCIADLPVGDNLHDHLFVPMTFVTKDAQHRGTAPHFAAGVARENTRGNTWVARTVFEAAGFVRSSHAHGDVPDLQIHALPWSYPSPNQDAPTRHKVDKRPALTIMPTLIYPKSRGSVRLASNDPTAAPADRPRLPCGAGRLRPAARGHQADPRGDGAVARSRAASTSSCHPGADYFDDAAMAAELPNRAHHRLPPRRHLPDGRRRARRRRPGAPGARHRRPARRGHRDHAVITGGNTNAPAMMIGERCAELMLEG